MERDFKRLMLKDLFFGLRRANRFLRSGTEWAYGALLPARQAGLSFCTMGLRRALKVPEGEPRKPTLIPGANVVPFTSASRRAGVETRMEKIFNSLFILYFFKCDRVQNRCFVPAPRAGIRYGGPAHQAGFLWSTARIIRQPAPQPVAGRRHLPKRCFGSGCARPVATLKGAGPPHRTPTLSLRTASVTCPSASRHTGVGTCIFQSAGSKSGKQSSSCSSQRTRTRMPMRTSRGGSSTPTILETRRGPSSRSIHATA